jgi:hypothetical protein
MLSSIILNTIAVPFVSGIGFGLLLMFSASRKQVQASALFITVLLPLLIAAAYCLIEGLPAIPPVAAKQKLPLLIMGGSLVFAAVAPRLAHRDIGLALVAWVIAMADILILGQRIVANNPPRVALAVAVSTIAMVATFAAMQQKGRAAEMARLSFPTAVFSAMIGAALAAAFSAFVGMAQANGAIAALIGGANLVFLLAGSKRQGGLYDLDKGQMLAITLALIPHLVMTVLFTPKLPVIGLLLSAGCFVAPWLSSRFAQPVLRLPHAFAVIILGFIAIMPAAGAAVISSFSYAQ